MEPLFIIDNCLFSTLKRQLSTFVVNNCLAILMLLIRPLLRLLLLSLLLRHLNLLPTQPFLYDNNKTKDYPIHFNLSEPIVTQVVGLSTSHAIWKALSYIFSSTSHARIMNIRFQRVIIDYFHKVKSCRYPCSHSSATS